MPKAFVVLKKEQQNDVTASDLIVYVKEQVADSKQLRGGLEFVDAIPKIGIGKIDRNALKRLAQI